MTYIYINTLCRLPATLVLFLGLLGHKMWISTSSSLNLFLCNATYSKDALLFCTSFSSWVEERGNGGGIVVVTDSYTDKYKSQCAYNFLGSSK